MVEIISGSRLWQRVITSVENKQVCNNHIKIKKKKLRSTLVYYKEEHCRFS